MKPSQPTRAPIAILGVPFDNTTTAGTLEIIAGMIASGRPHYAATANVDFIVQALEDVELRRILFDAHLVLADGQPIVWASKFLGNPLPERVTGSGMIPRLLQLAEEREWKVFFLGGTEESVRLAAAKTCERHPRLKLVGAYSPPFKPLLEMDHADLLARLQAAKPDILLVAFGCPKQEKWIAMNYLAAGVPFSVGVGATIDFLAGTFKRAPEWMQRTGLEWGYRLSQEPGRLVKRYGKDLRVFSVGIFKQWWRMKNREQLEGPASPAIVVEEPGGIEIITSPNRLDAATVEAHQDAWRQIVTEANVILDLTEAQFVDSTGVGALIRLRKLARDAGHGFVLAGVTPALSTALRLMKLEDFFPIETTVAGARGRMPSELRALHGGVQLQQGNKIVKWQGEVTAATAPQLGAAMKNLLDALPPGSHLIADLAEVRFVDSTGIGLMLGLKKKCRRQDVTLSFRSPGEAVRNTFRLARLESYLLGENP